MLPLKYNVNIVTHKKMEIALMFCWLTGLFAGVIFSILNSNEVANVTGWSLGGVFLVLAVTTYTVIFTRISTPKQRFSREASITSTRSNNQVSHHSKFYCMTGMIIASFILFVNIPVCFMVFYPNSKTLTSRIISSSWCVNILIDPCVYIFLQIAVRTLLKRKLASWRR